MANPNGVGGFTRGKSGNPSGRPKSNDVIVALAQACTEEAIEVLAEIMRDESKPTAARVSAATALLDRGYGRPTQALTLAGNEDQKPPISVIRMIVVSPTEQMRVVQELGSSPPYPAPKVILTKGPGLKEPSPLLLQT